MKLKNFILGIALFLVASLASADNCFNGPCEKADLPTCGAKLKGKEFVVKNCVSATSCSTTASPGFAVRQVCDYTGSVWAYRNSDSTAAPNLSAYAILAGDADGQIIQGFTGSDQPRIDLGDSEVSIYGDGALPSSIQMTTDGNFAIWVNPEQAARNSLLETSVSNSNKVLRVRNIIRLLGDETLPTCDAAMGGSIAFDDSSKEFCGCNGTSWAALDGAGACA